MGRKKNISYLKTVGTSLTLCLRLRSESRAPCVVVIARGRIRVSDTTVSSSPIGAVYRSDIGVIGTLSHAGLPTLLFPVSELLGEMEK